MREEELEPSPDDAARWRRPRQRHPVVLHPKLSFALAIAFTVLSVAAIWIAIPLVLDGIEPSGRVPLRSGGWLFLAVVASPVLAVYFWVSAFTDRRAWEERRERESADPNSATRRPWWVA